MQDRYSPVQLFFKNLTVKMRTFYNALMPGDPSKQLQKAETETEVLRVRAEQALNAYLALSTTKHPIHRLQMERELLESLLRELGRLLVRFEQ
jgi:hypothetical protein